MEIEVHGLDTGLMIVAVGLAAMGYFIGKGLKNMGKPEKGYNYHHFIKESDLEFYLNLNKNEIEELLKKYPGAPKIELNGITYYPYNQLMEWLSSNKPYNN